MRTRFKIFITKKPELSSCAFPFALGAKKFDVILFIENLGYKFDSVLFNSEPFITQIAEYQAYKGTKK